MKIEDIKQLIKAVSDSKITSFDYSEDGVMLSFKKEKDVVALSEVMPEKTVISVSSEKTESTAEGFVVKSPLVGTVYVAPEEGAEPFVKVGDHVKKGQTLAIVEAMKLMNTIESERDGVIAEILIENAHTVEYGQEMFVIC